MRRSSSLEVLQLTRRCKSWSYFLSWTKRSRYGYLPDVVRPRLPLASGDWRHRELIEQILWEIWLVAELFALAVETHNRGDDCGHLAIAEVRVCVANMEWSNTHTTISYNVLLIVLYTRCTKSTYSIPKKRSPSNRYESSGNLRLLLSWWIYVFATHPQLTPRRKIVTIVEAHLPRKATRMSRQVELSVVWYIWM